MDKNIQNYPITVEAKDMAEITVRYQKILSFIDRKRSIPYKLVRNFMALFKNADVVLNESLEIDSFNKALIAEQASAN